MGKKEKVISVKLEQTTKTVRLRNEIVVGGDKYFVHKQDIPLLQWVIAHNLHKNPSVSVVDSGGNEVEGEVQYLDDNTLVIKFSHEFGGKAYLN